MGEYIDLTLGQAVIHRGDFAHTNAAHDNDDSVLVHINYGMSRETGLFRVGDMFPLEVKNHTSFFIYTACRFLTFPLDQDKRWFDKDKKSLDKAPPRPDKKEEQRKRTLFVTKLLRNEKLQILDDDNLDETLLLQRMLLT